MSEMSVHMIDVLDHIMRLLKRRHHTHHGRGAERILHMVLQQPDITTRELAELLDVRPSSLNETLARLEERELVLRRRSPEDLRVYTVEVTEKGKARLEESAKERMQFYEQVEHILSEEEFDQFMHLAEKLTAGLEELVPEGDEETHHHPRRGMRR